MILPSSCCLRLTWFYCYFPWSLARWQNLKAVPVTSLDRTQSCATFSTRCTAQNQTVWYDLSRPRVSCLVWYPYVWIQLYGWSQWPGPSQRCKTESLLLTECPFSLKGSSCRPRVETPWWGTNWWDPESCSTFWLPRCDRPPLKYRVRLERGPVAPWLPCRFFVGFSWHKHDRCRFFAPIAPKKWMKVRRCHFFLDWSTFKWFLGSFCDAYWSILVPFFFILTPFLPLSDTFLVELSNLVPFLSIFQIDSVLLLEMEVGSCPFYSTLFDFTSPKAPLPITLRGSKSSTPNLDLFKRRNSVSFTACWARFSDFFSSGSSLRDSSSLWSLTKKNRLENCLPLYITLIVVHNGLNFLEGRTKFWIFFQFRAFLCSFQIQFWSLFVWF